MMPLSHQAVTPRWDSNPQNSTSKAYTYTYSVNRAHSF
ncbi:hypothetical protein bas34_0094 [Escherichia phage SelmaRatti]|uniref:Uncharacterized protein n=1 Tax=Escherichia phage SelmaRatti TaxID=2852006 RepID=A0AAE8B4T3_9CAUD|nr:hypothetical protein bas34_0094 [Escherichia phage SelmaRatti]